MSEDLLEYGEKVNASHLNRILEHIFLRNDEIAETGGRGTPICIWGLDLRLCKLIRPQPSKGIMTTRKEVIAYQEEITKSMK